MTETKDRRDGTEASPDPWHELEDVLAEPVLVAAVIRARAAVEAAHQQEIATLRAGQTAWRDAARAEIASVRAERDALTAHRQEMANLLLHCSQCGMTYQGHLNDPEGSAICFDSYGHKWTRDELRIDAQHRAEVEKLTHERDHWRQAWSEAQVKADTLNTKTADELYEQNVALTAQIAALREDAHYAKGCADLAMKHRDEAESERDFLAAQVATLRTALGTVYDAFRESLLDESYRQADEIARVALVATAPKSKDE